jgi:hypothetical protein
MAQYYAERKAEITEQRKARRQSHREEINAADRERYASDPAARELRKTINTRYKQKIKENLPADPALQKKHNDQLAKRREKHKERLSTDPEYRKLVDAYNAKQREKRRLKKEHAPSE